MEVIRVGHAGMYTHHVGNVQLHMIKSGRFSWSGATAAGLESRKLSGFQWGLKVQRPEIGFFSGLAAEKVPCHYRVIWASTGAFSIQISS